LRLSRLQLPESGGLRGLLQEQSDQRRRYLRVSVSLKVSKTVKGSISASAEIKEIFNISATYETSKTIEDTVSVTLKPKQGVELNVVGILKTYTFSAERWYKATFINGEVRHIFDAQISGEAVAVSGGRVTVTNL
jgi:c-di-GMP-binding flagellar brake protein YcgR